MLWLRNGLNPINLESSITTGCFGKCAIGHSGGTQPYSIEQQKLSLVSRLSRGKIFTRTRRTYVPLRDRQNPLKKTILVPKGRIRFSEHAQSLRFVSANRICQIWQEICESLTSGVWPALRSRILVLIKRSAPSGDENVTKTQSAFFKNYQESDWLS